MKMLNRGLLVALLGLVGVSAFAENHHIALNNILVGGYFDGKWLTPDKMQGSTWLWGGEQAQVFYPDGRQEDGTACAIHRDHPDEEFGKESASEPDAPVFDVQFPSYRSVSYPSHTLVITREVGWDVMPRKAEKLPPNNAQYKALVADFLAGRKLPHQRVELTHLQKVDLDGNGMDEVIMVGYAAGGKTPFAMLRQIQQGHVATTMLAEPSDGKVVDIYTADINGDGRMEVILGTQTRKQIHQMVYTVSNGDADRVIRNSWPVRQRKRH